MGALPRAKKHPPCGDNDASTTPHEHPPGVRCVTWAAQPLDLPRDAAGICALPELKYDAFLAELRIGDIAEICVPTPERRITELNSSSNADEAVLGTERQRRFNEQDWEALKGNPVYGLAREYADVLLTDKTPTELPPDRGVRHEIDLEPGTKYCVTRQWPLPKEQVEAIDEFFAQRARAGQVRESKSPHSSPTFCVRKATGGWRIVHAFNKLNDAAVPAQTPIPRKDVIIHGMSGSTIFSALDLMDGFYQILVRAEDVPKTAVSTPSGMLWEWLVMPQGLKNAPATFNRLVQNVMRRHRGYAPSYFDDIYVHSKAVGGRSALEMHLHHLRLVLALRQSEEVHLLR